MSYLDRRAWALVVAFAGLGCGAPEPTFVSPAVTSAEPRSAPSAAPAPARSSVPIEAVPEPLTSVSIVLHPGDEPCTIVFDGEAVDEPDAWSLRTVRHLGTVQGSGCSAGIMFDTKAETAPGASVMAALPAIFWIKPGHTLPAEDAPRASELPPGIADLDFDGYLDVCAIIDPTNETPQHCWIFDPKRRVFAHSPAIDVIPNLQVDAEKKVLDGFAHSGSIYVGTEYGWINGKLELVRRSTSYLGETPRGDSIPGYVYFVVEERRGGRMVKVRDGASKE